MQEELYVVKANNTWTMVPLPSTHRVIDCKWIFKDKYYIIFLENSETK